MISKFCLTFKQDHVLTILLLVLVWLNYTATVISEGNQVKAAVVMNKKCIDKERRALLDIKALLQDPIGCLSTWGIDEEDDCCEWRGDRLWSTVTCNDQTGHVIDLDLSGCKLEGEISPSLLNLTELTGLSLSTNSFNGTIPTSIGSLTELTYIDLSFNSFRGVIPRSFGSLTKLRSLDLSDNLLYGIIPPEFGNLTNMLELYFHNMGICRVENLDWLSNLTQLRKLEMYGVSLAKANHWVNIVTSLQGLEDLSLGGGNLSQVMHPYLPSSVNSSLSSSSIISLDLVDNNLNSSIYHWMFPLTSNRLQSLSLGGNKLDGLPKYFGNLCSLGYLSLTGNSALVNFSDFLNNLSGCTAATLGTLDVSSSQFTGSLSDDIQNFSSLVQLELNQNQLNGISEKVWELPNLNWLYVSSNSLRGALSVNFHKSKLSYIDFSNNLIQEIHSKPLKSKSDISFVNHLDLSACKLGPRFPKWVETHKNLTYLNIASNGISDTIPLEFWNMWPSQLTYLNISFNNISGKVPDLLSNFCNGSVIDLSSNNFYGPVPNAISTFTSLNLSKNKLYGEISFLCQFADLFLEHLDLSKNSFSGQLPDCLWHFKNLKVLNLGDNNFSGRLPASIEYLIELKVLYLYNNNFSGELPLSLRNCTNLNILDLGVNKFSGYVPVWIGEISNLYVLSLTSNNFFGFIPIQFCKLVKLQILDLSMNNLYGTIPSCINNLTAMDQVAFLSMLAIPLDVPFTYHIMVNWQGSIREFSSNLGLLKSIDLSSNNLTGKIPNEVTNLDGLITLNLSMNALLGEIPQNIGRLKELLIFDLSRNNLSGGLPSNMSQMTSLDYLDVSYNSLSGRIPSSTQLQSFEPSRYTGNEALCGPPLTNHCPGDKELQVKPPIGVSQGDGVDKDELERWFYIGGTTGFAIGFWMVCSALLINRRGRHTFFHFLGSLENWVYVKVTVFIAKFQRAAHT